MATVPNANLKGDFFHKLQFARALSTGDSDESLADDAWTVYSFGGGRLANDRLVTFFKAWYGTNAYNAGDLAGFDNCFGAVVCAAIADTDDIRALAKVELSKILKKDRVYRHQFV